MSVLLLVNLGMILKQLYRRNLVVLLTDTLRATDGYDHWDWCIWLHYISFLDSRTNGGCCFCRRRRRGCACCCCCCCCCCGGCCFNSGKLSSISASWIVCPLDASLSTGNSAFQLVQVMMIWCPWIWMHPWKMTRLLGLEKQTCSWRGFKGGCYWCGWLEKAMKLFCVDFWQACLVYV